MRGDIRAPCVIGALWSKTAPPPSVAVPPTSVMLIRSRNGVTLRILDDKDNNSLVVETPGGQRMTLQDSPGTVRVEDALGNSVTLSPSGVKVIAASTVEVSASTFEVRAGMVTVDADVALQRRREVRHVDQQRGGERELHTWGRQCVVNHRRSNATNSRRKVVVTCSAAPDPSDHACRAFRDE